MQNLYPDNLRLHLGRSGALFLFSIFIILAVWWIRFLYVGFRAEEYLSNALKYQEKARSLPAEEVVARSIAYRNVMRLLSSSIKMEPAAARPYFEYGQVIAAIAEDPGLTASLDLSAIGTPGSNSIRPADGRIYALAGDCYREATKREPTNAIYHQRLGAVFATLGQPVEAEEEFEKAVKLDGENVSIRIFLAQYFYSRGREAQFKEHLDKAVGLFKVSLQGGGELSSLVTNFLEKIGREDLIK
jgi:tetratricopeptide (TPR) repeat protein